MQLFEYIDILDKPYDIFYTNSVFSPMHWHYYSEVLYMLEGKIRLICNDDSIVLEQGDLCYIYPLQLHEVQKVSDEPVRYVVIKFDIHTIHIPDAYLTQIYDYFIYRTNKNDFCLCLKDALIDTDNMKHLICRTVEEYERKEELFSLQIQAFIFTLLIQIARRINKEPNTHSDKRTDTDFSFFHILEYIDTHSCEELDVSELAEKCHMSYSHFAKLFKENYGRSCKEYITYIRLNKAHELLLHTDYDITYIAQETGFFDSSHFIHAYKKWKGITPKQVRKYL